MESLLRTSTASTDKNPSIYSGLFFQKGSFTPWPPSHPNPLTTVRLLRAKRRNKFSHIKSQGDSITPAQHTDPFSAGSSNIQTSCHTVNILLDLFVFNNKCYENILKLKPYQFSTARQVFRSIQFRQGAEQEMTQSSSVNDSMVDKKKIARIRQLSKLAKTRKHQVEDKWIQTKCKAFPLWCCLLTTRKD